jgi:FlaA1/EpsC-like NDP-sugar epimerase
MPQIDFIGFVRDILNSPLRRYLQYYNAVLALAIAVLGGFSLWLAYIIRFEFDIPPEHFYNLLHVMGLACVVKPFAFFALGGHRANWRYVDHYDLEIIFLSCLISSLVLLLAGFFSSWLYIPRGVIIIDLAISTLIVYQVRIAARIAREVLLPRIRARQHRRSQDPLSVIVVGAGDAGESLLNEMKRNLRLNYDVKAIFDDDPSKRGFYVHGIKVVGRVQEIPEFVRESTIDLVIVAIPSANKNQMLRIYNILKPLEIPIKTVPYLYELPATGSLIGSLRDLNISDFLGRDEITVNTDEIKALIRDKVVLVTGAGGSIGSEICLQVLGYDPARLVMVDKSENLLFHLNRKLLSLESDGRPTRVYPELCDLRDFASLKRAMEKHSPQLVLHAAAHKHVFLQELNPVECFFNNVGGIRNIVRLSHEFGVLRFVLISTDKAINPTSVMGASKRICEMYCGSYSYISKTVFMAVRFGNVIGSEGSVIPIFIDQINKGGPVTVTHPDVERYFMTIPEAVTLVLQAAAIGSPGQVLMLEMGSPIKIVDLARQLIALAGKTEEDIPIRFIGLKPGEKLFEELNYSAEMCIPTEHKKITIWKSPAEKSRDIIQKVDSCLEKSDWSPDGSEIRAVMRELVPEYRPADWQSS